MKNRMLVLPLLYHDLRSGYNMYSALPICRRSPGGPVKPSVLNGQLNDMVVQDWTGLDRYPSVFSGPPCVVPLKNDLG